MAPEQSGRLEEAFEALAKLGAGPALTAWIGRTEHSLSGLDRDALAERLDQQAIVGPALEAALLIKSLAGQVNVIVHATGLLASLPYILKPGEVVESMSLGAGNTGRAHDLETSWQIAEFKFIEWRGGAESIRQNTLFIDLFNLATAVTTKRRVLYVVGKREPMRFLQNRRALSSVLSKNSAVQARFTELHGDSYRTVRDYFETVRDQVDIVDLRDIVPAFRSAAARVLD